jgi:hypothetical protein
MKSKMLDSLLNAVTPESIIANSFKRSTSPWNDDPMEFFESDKFCNMKLYPRQRLMLKLWNLQLDDLSDYEKKTLDSWRASFSNDQYTIGVNEDIYERIAILKKNGYLWFNTIIPILGRRASKTMMSGAQLCLQDATLMWDGIPSVTVDDAGEGEDKDDSTYSFVIAKTQGQAKETTFAAHYNAVMHCKWLKQYIERATPFEIRFQTFDDRMQSIDLVSQGMPLEKPISSFVARPVSSDSDSIRGRACVSPDSYVLDYQRHWVQLSTIHPGSRILAFHEHEPYSLTEAVVLNMWKTKKECVRLHVSKNVNMPLVCSIDHKVQMNDWSWKEAGALSKGDIVRTADSTKTVLEVEHVGEQDLIDMTTSSHTYLANNIRSHNCVSLAYDEIFFANAGQSSRSGDRGVKAMQPALQQFGKYKLMLFPSSPWTRNGVVYDKYLQGREHVKEYIEKYGLSSKEKDALDKDIEHTKKAIITDPTIFVAQLESWNLYEDFDSQAYVPTYYSGFKAKKLVIDDNGHKTEIVADTNAVEGDYVYVE